MQSTRTLAAAALAAAFLSLSPLALNIAAGQAAPVNAAAQPLADLPIRKLTLYRSGVGYFERHGSVQGEQSAQLKFKTDQINDILKSMVMLDLDGGSIDTVKYNSKEPLSRRLAAFGIDISQYPSIPELLSGLRGTKINITSTDGSYAGTILGVEYRTVAPQASDSKLPATNVPYVNLVTSSGIRSVMIANISTFTFDDAELNDELNKALGAIADQRNENTKTVDLGFRGNGDNLRRVVVGYIHEMPMWKTSYRLVLPDLTGTDPAQPNNLTLQGWAIVENTTDEDWNDVRLSLASGRPVSFQMDLYEPFFMQRPMLPVPGAIALLPRNYESGRDEDGAMKELLTRMPAPASVASDQAERGYTPARQRVELAKDANGAGRPLASEDFAAYSPASQATGGEVGEQFMYTLDVPISLERQRSAMLPIITAPVEGRRVSIFNALDTPTHPMRGVQFTNNSGLQLLPGPISVLDGGTYAGDATIPNTSRNQKQLLAYAQDLDVRVTSKNDSTSTTLNFKIADGLLIQTMKQRMSVTHDFNNLDPARPRLILIEHPIQPGWTITAPEKPIETTDSLVRFELPVEAAKSAAITITSERTIFERFELFRYPVEALAGFVRNGTMSQPVADALRKASEIQRRINTLTARITQLESQRREITDEQSRIRNNMSTISNTSELYGRYMKKLSEQETEMEKITTERDEAQSQKTAAEQELNAYISTLKVE